ncbi:MAG: ADP-ribosylglycohydrolase family protein [Actinobacteria bacterium]|nr:ADP-ribosylglycohydrolase family protein [Actinomycetota bacterium]
MTILEAKAIGCLTGAAVGDSLGGSTETYSPEQIQERFGGFVTGIVPPFNVNWQTARPVSPFHKGDGHITDDTLMTEALIAVYEKVRDHLDAFSFAENIVPQMIEFERWIPELERESLIVHRVFHAEKWLVLKLHHAHADPREAGVGNIVNCGASMYMSPVGIVNAGNPEGAYAEAIEITGAHQSSYGREAAGVFAACVAAAMIPGATAHSIIDIAIKLAHDGTRSAIEAVVEKADSLNNWQTSLAALREAFRPFDSVGENYKEPGPDARKPSRLKSIEELPLALGFLALSKGDFKEGVLGAINYGRDSDSIATMFGAISGAMHGREAIPIEWAETIERESKIDLISNGKKMAKIASEIAALDKQKWSTRESTMQALLAGK